MLFQKNVGIFSLLRNSSLIDFTPNFPDKLASIRHSRLDQAARLELVPLTLREEENTNVDVVEVVDAAVLEEEFKDKAVAKSEDRGRGHNPY